MRTNHRKGLCRGQTILAAAIVAVITVFLSVAHAAISEVTVGDQFGSLPYGTLASATFPLTVTVDAAATVDLCVSTALPAGATASFSPASFIFADAGAQASTLTITTDGVTAVAVGATAFTVSARTGGTCGAPTGAVSVSTSFTVDKATPTTVINAADLAASSNVGSPYTFRYTVTPPGVGTPTGNVLVTDGTDSCTGTVAAGSCSLTSSTAGAKTMYAAYSGDGNFEGSFSAGGAHTVAKGTPSFSNLSDYDVVVGFSSITLTGTLKAGTVLPTFGETVTATVNAVTTSGTVGSDGIFSIAVTTASLAAGSYTVTYNFAGDDNLNAAAADTSTKIVVAANAAAVLRITVTSPLPTAVKSQAYSVDLAISGGTAPYTWALRPGSSLPAGLSITGSPATPPATAKISGTPTVDGTFSFMLEAHDAAGTVAFTTQTFSLTIVPGLTILTTSPLANAIKGESFSETLSGIGGAPAYAWSVSGGSLPAGLSLDAGTGTISGTPTTLGTTTFTAKVTDSALAFVTKDFTITVISGFRIDTPAVLPIGKMGDLYGVTLVAKDGTAPYNWSVTDGALPTGLSLDALTGRISGTPSAGGNWIFKIAATDVTSARAETTFLVRIDPVSTLRVTTGSIGPAALITYTTASPVATLAATAGSTPYTWSVASGKPSWMPSYTYLINELVVDGNGHLQKVTTAGTSGDTTPTWSTSGGTAADNTVVWRDQGVAPSGTLLDELTLQPSGADAGKLTGTPLRAGTYIFTVQVTDAAGATAFKTLSLTVNSGSSALAIATTSLATATVGTAYTPSLSASGGAGPGHYTWAVSSGKPTWKPSYTYLFNEIIVDGNLNLQKVTTAGTSKASEPGAPSGPPPAPLNTAWNTTLAGTTTDNTVTWTNQGPALAGTTWDELTLSSGGVFSGTPLRAGTFTFTVHLTDDKGGSVYKTFTLLVNPAP